ncbi:hypothetical protein PMAYCL1PPCAC_05122, partial [Pristionchus mayeri]
PLDELNLLNLHSDVIRKIVRVGMEDVDSMKQILPKWNSVVKDHMNNRKNLPVIEYFGWKRQESTG